jgi:Tol biopolymer transport system component
VAASNGHGGSKRGDLMGIRRASGAAGVALVVAAGLTGCEPPTAWVPEVIDLDGPAGTSSDAGSAVLSPDDRLVAFVSHSSGFGPTDTNGDVDVYLHDRQTGETELVSVNADGTDSGRGVAQTSASQQPVFSPDGTKLAFVSSASDLVPGGTGDGTDVFVRDLVAGTTEWVSAPADGIGEDDHSWSGGPVFSPDSSQVAFHSDAQDLVPGQPAQGAHTAYVRDLTTSTTRPAVGRPDGSFVEVAWPYGWSPDGASFGFSTSAPLAPEDVDSSEDVYVLEVGSGTTAFASNGTAGVLDYDATFGSFSPDGTSLTFSMQGFRSDFTMQTDVYITDLDTQETRLVSRAADGSGQADGSTGSPAFTSDGETLVVMSSATDLGPIDRHPQPSGRIFTYDIAADTFSLVAANTGDGPGWIGYVLSPTGDELAFTERGDVYTWDIPGRRARFAIGDSGVGEIRAVDYDSTGSRLLVSAFSSTTGRSDLFLAEQHVADLSVELSGEASTSGGVDTFTYEVVVANGGPDEAPGARVLVVIPEGSTVVDGGDCTVAGPQLPTLASCEIGDLAVGEQATISFAAAADLAPGTAFTTTVTAGAAGIDPDGSDDSATVDLTAA